MTAEQIEKTVEKQCEYFKTGATLPIKARKLALKRLKAAITAHEREIKDALYADLNKSGFEADMCEIRLVLAEISYLLKHIKKFARAKRVATPLSQFAAKSFKMPSPYGVALIMSPWNYPFMLALDPLADAIAAGNCAVVKPSAYSPATSAAVAEIIAETFPENFVAVVTGGRAENAALLDNKFDYIFFTGSVAVGKEVMRRASERLIPVTLELGGKSPCIVDSTAKIKLAAKRIVFGKFLNCGQTCVAPDYVYCDEKIKDELIAAIKDEMDAQLGARPLDSPDCGKIINEKHFKRICALIDDKKTVKGGGADAERLRIEPTLMDGVEFSDPVMCEEIFGPVLPVLTFKSNSEALEKIMSLPHPLALYIFSRDKKNVREFLSRTGFGGGCVNDTIIHLATSNMGFGGFGESGMGSYHGKDGFAAFSHYKSVVNKRQWLDLPMRYRPYKKFYHKLVRFFLK